MNSPSLTVSACGESAGASTVPKIVARCGGVSIRARASSARMVSVNDSGDLASLPAAAAFSKSASGPRDHQPLIFSVNSSEGTAAAAAPFGADGSV